VVSSEGTPEALAAAFSIGRSRANALRQPSRAYAENRSVKEKAIGLDGIAPRYFKINCSKCRYPTLAETQAVLRASKVLVTTFVTSPTECRAEPGAFAPAVDRSRCEGKAECVEVCPYAVFEVRRMDDVDFAQLGLLAKLKSLAHGRQTAYAPRASACHACGKCVAACPEKAIQLVRGEPELPSSWSCRGRGEPELPSSSPSGRVRS
jgi:4Fe-4S ferredoxin